MKDFIKKILRKFGLEITRYYATNNNDTKCISLKPDNENKGSVLLSYIIEPFLLKEGESVSNAHTHDQESFHIAQTFLDLGYCVDVISYKDNDYLPDKNYSFFVGARTNFQRIAKLLNKDCVKIVHLDTAHWLLSNSSSYLRCLALQKRRGFVLDSFKFKWVNPNWAIEYADYATILGNQFTIDSYSYAQKPIYRIPISTTATYSWNEEKNYKTCRNSFIWFGSGGLVHKGLDLVLDAFTEMPDYHLTVCGPIKEDKEFEEAFYQELYEAPNIHTIGWVDVESSDFLEITNNCLGLVYPSCSEGGGGSVINCMHAGLIPIVSYESSVDINDDFGIILKDCTIDEIKKSIIKLSNLPAGELKRMARKTWEYARANHSREKFAEECLEVINNIISDHMKSDISTDQFSRSSSHLLKKT